MNLARQIFLSPPVAIDPLGLAEKCRGSHPVASASRCCNLFGGGSSKSTTSTASDVTDIKVGASDQGKSNYGGSQATDQGIAGSTVGSIVSGGGKIDITTADPEVLKKALEEYAQVSGAFQKSLQDILEQQNKSEENTTTLQNSLFDTLSSRIKDLTENEQTQGLSQVTKIVGWVVLGLLLVGLVLAWKRK